MKKGQEIPNPEIKLSIKSFKIPVEFGEDDVIEKTLDLTSEMVVGTEDIILDRTKDNVTLKIQEHTGKVLTYNQNQRKLALRLKRDYIIKKILTKL